MDFYNDIKERFFNLIKEKDLMSSKVEVVSARTLTHQEVIGKPERDDFPLLKGKEVMLQADFKGSLGQAFTDMPGNYSGGLQEVLAMPLDNNFKRAVFIATLNAVLRYLNYISKTVHCKDKEPGECAAHLVDYIKEQGWTYYQVFGKSYHRISKSAGFFDDAFFADIPDDSGFNFIKMMKESDYDQGVGLLVAKAIKDDKELEAGRVIMFDINRFRVGTQLLFTYEYDNPPLITGKWIWSDDTWNWHNVTEKSDLGDYVNDVLLSLEGQDLYEGAVKIFDMNFEDYYKNLVLIQDESAWAENDNDGEKYKVAKMAEDLKGEINCDNCGDEDFWKNWELVFSKYNAIEKLLGLQNKCTRDQCELIGAISGRNCVFKKDDYFWGLIDLGNGACEESEVEGPSLPSPTQMSRFSDKDFLKRIEGYNTIIEKYAKQYGVEVDLIKAMITQESFAQISAHSGADAWGLMQVRKIAAKEVGMEDEYDDKKQEADYGIHVGVKYYAHMMDKYKDTNSGEILKRMSLAAYNDGPTDINIRCKDKKWENCKDLPGETLQYVANVLAYEKKFADLKGILFDINALISSADIGYASQQIRDSDSDLKSFLLCVDKEYEGQRLYGNHILINSLTDDRLYNGKCDLSNKNVNNYKNDNKCKHAKGSCHYYGASSSSDWLPKSKAVDLKVKGFDEPKLKRAVKNCADSEGIDVLMCDEGNHLHVSIEGCETTGEGDCSYYKGGTYLFLN